MLKLTKLASILAILGTISACQDDPQTNTPEPQAVTLKGLALSAPQAQDMVSGEIASPTFAPINQNQDYVSFVAPISVNLDELNLQQTQTRISDEYWMTVSGRELNQGIALTISQSSSVIRIAARGDISSGALIQADAISPKNIQLIAPTDSNMSIPEATLIRSLVDSEALATAGLVDDSSALIMSASAKAGQYQLKVNQSLIADAQYLVNVKEKNSPYQLSLSTPSTVEQQTQQLTLDIALSESTDSYTPTARLKRANGETTALKMTYSGGQWQAELPEELIDTSTDKAQVALSEIQVDVITKVNGKPVRRTVKTAFKPYVNSAKILPQVQSQWHDALPQALIFDLDIAKEGRFGIKGILVGTDTTGQQQAILQTQAAAWLTPEMHQLRVPLDPAIIKASGLTAPFELKALELQDQGQMARISYQAHALTLAK